MNLAIKFFLWLKLHRICAGPSKHEDLTQCCFNVGPAPLAVGQLWNSIGSNSRVCWGVLRFDIENINFIVSMAKPWNIRYDAVSWLNPIYCARPDQYKITIDSWIRIYFFNNIDWCHRCILKLRTTVFKTDSVRDQVEREKNEIVSYLASRVSLIHWSRILTSQRTHRAIINNHKL